MGIIPIFHNGIAGNEKANMPFIHYKLILIQQYIIFLRVSLKYLSIKGPLILGKLVGLTRLSTYYQLMVNTRARVSHGMVYRRYSNTYGLQIIISFYL